MNKGKTYHTELIQDVARTVSLISQLVGVVSIKGDSEFKEIRIKEIVSQVNAINKKLGFEPIPPVGTLRKEGEKP